MSLPISVVVPTHNRPALLARCLTALLRQDFAPANYEIIVADNAASTTTRQLVERLAAAQLAGLPALRYIPVPRPQGPAAARNAGWRAARGAIIAFTDDDCLPTPTWLRCGFAAFTDDVAGISGQVVVPLPPVPTDFERNFAHLERSEFVTANCFYRRAALDQLGGFDEQFTLPWREDSDLFFRLLKRGSHLAYAPAAIVQHPVRPVPWGISLYQQRKSMFNALLYKKHPELYRLRLTPVTPWHYYAIVLTILTALTGLLSQHYRLTTVATLLWLLLTGRFCLQRLDRTSHAPHHVAEMLITSALIPPMSVFWRIVGAIKFRVLFL